MQLRTRKRTKRKKLRRDDSESDTTSGSESESAEEPILKPNKEAQKVIGTQPHAHGLQPVHYRPPLPFKGNKDEDWNEFKNKLIKMFRTLQLDDTQAADQFCTYLEGWAYKHWDGLAEDIQASFPKVIKAFDKKYSNDLEQDEWQMRYETMKYLGPEKETLDQLAGRIKDIVNKAYPDVTRKGVVYSRKEQRQRVVPEESSGIYSQKKYANNFSYVSEGVTLHYASNYSTHDASKPRKCVQTRKTNPMTQSARQSHPKVLQ